MRVDWLFAENVGRRCCLSQLGVAALVAACGVEPSLTNLEVYPLEKRLRVGDRINYSVFQRHNGTSSQIDDYTLLSQDPTIVRVVGERQLEALSPGTARVLVQSDTGQTVLPIDVDPASRPPISAVHHSEIDRIAGEELLFVGHANLDGFDHTAVAKPGIDRMVREFKADGHPVIYFVGEEYPHWYTEDRQPDLAVVSEGQEHQILVDAERIVFTGGDFMFCTVRNVQMTLHGMLKAKDRNRIQFVLVTDAIWAVDIFTEKRFRPYPAPMAVLAQLMAEHSSDQDRYERVVMPFMDRLIDDFPVLGYPASSPAPPLDVLADGWTIEVGIGAAFRQRYQSGDPEKVIRIDFESKSPTGI